MELQNWFQKHKTQIFDDFFQFLRFKSIATDPQFDSEVEGCAQFLQKYLSDIGLKVERWETKGSPILFAETPTFDPNAYTILFYGHYDVQPVEPFAEWDSDPFEPTVKGNEIYARGASDDKGQIFYTIIAIKAFLELHQKKNVHIKLLIEGEEESGSEHLFQMLKEKKEKLQCDSLLVVDMSMYTKDQPSIVLGSRGIATFDLTLQGSKGDLHSGAQGGIAYNPNRALCELMASCFDNKGYVRIPGFYDGIRTLTEEEKKELPLTLKLEENAKKIGVYALGGIQGKTFLETNWLLPTLEINGIWGGYIGSGFKTVIPAQAHAKLSIRLVPYQDPKHLQSCVMDFLKKNVPQGIQVRINKHAGAEGYMASPFSEIVTITKKAYEEVYQKRCLTTLSGGSIPIAKELSSCAKKGLLLMGVALDTDAIHAPNEHFGVDRFEKGVYLIGRILENLSRI